MRTLSSQGFHIPTCSAGRYAAIWCPGLPDHDICATCVDTALERASTCAQRHGGAGSPHLLCISPMLQ